MTLATLIDAIMANGGVTEQQAREVVRVYHVHKLVTTNAHDGYVLKHGALLDKAVIERALAQDIH